MTPMVNIRQVTKDRMAGVLTSFVMNSNKPMNKQAILKATESLNERSYTHTIVMLKECGFISNGEGNQRIKSWRATALGLNWVANRLAEAGSNAEENLGIVADNLHKRDFGRDSQGKLNSPKEASTEGYGGMPRYAPPEIKFVPSASLAPAGSVSNGDVVRLNLTDMMRFINAIIGDRSHGELSWVRDGKHYSVQVNDGEIHLFLEGN